MSFANPLKLFVLIAIIFGIGSVLLSATVVLYNYSFYKKASRTEGIVVDIQRSEDKKGRAIYTTIVEFADREGVARQFPGESANYRAYALGDRVQVYYLPGDLNSPRIKETLMDYLGFVVLLGAGIFWLSVAGFVQWKFGDNPQMKAQLMAHGVTIMAEIVKVEEDSTFSVNNKRPYRIVASHPSNGQPMLYYSDRIWFDPKPLLAERQTIKIWVDPKNPSRYWMDINFLPKPA